ncbi:MAG: Fur family transcriptional regulator [Actinomycetota bacterium]
MSTKQASVGPVRATRQREAISAELDAAESFRSAQEVHEALRRAGSRVGLATVYRALQVLAASGNLDVLRSERGELLYRRCRKDGHHHHLVCRGCARSVEVESPEVEAWTERIARRHGFTASSHTVEVFGFCRDCS